MTPPRDAREGTRARGRVETGPDATASLLGPEQALSDDTRDDEEMTR